MRYIVMALMLITCCTMCYTPALAQQNADMSVIAEGSATVENGDLGKAEDEAIADAKRAAVEKAVGVFVKSEAYGEDYVVIKENILTKSEGYITTWDRVDGSRTVKNIGNSQLLTIKIEATVSLISLVDDLSNLQTVYDDIERPRVMVLIVDQIDDKPSKEHIAANAVIRELQDRGFDVIDGDMLERIKKVESYRGAFEPVDLMSISSVAKEQGAEILVLGRAAAFNQPLESLSDTLGDSLKASYECRMEARMVYADTAKILFAPKPSKGLCYSFWSANEAATKSLEDAGDKFISGDSQRFASQVLARWALQVQNGREFRVSAHGMTFSHFNAIKAAVRQFRGYVASAHEKYELRTGNVDFRIKLSMSSFCERLSAVTVGGKKIAVDKVFGNTVNVHISR